MKIKQKGNRMKNLKTIIIFSALAVILINVKPASSQESLYKRLGGYDAIAAVSDDFIAGLASNPQLGVFVKGLNEQSQKLLRQHLVDFICNVTGGPCLYLGQDMKSAHTGLHITDSEWDTAAGILVASLDKFNVGAKEKEELLAAVSSLKSQIVGQ